MKKLRTHKWIDILQYIKENGSSSYAVQIAKDLDITFSHVLNVLKTLHHLKLITYQKNGRIKNVVITKTGEELARSCDNILKVTIQTRHFK